MHVSAETRDKCLIVRLNRPEKKNALTTGMYASLAEALERLDKEPSLHALVLLGHDEAFSAGNDIGDFLTDPPTAEGSAALRFLYALAEAEKPVIAGVNGVAVGVGTTMLLHCDLVYAGGEATFQLPFVSMGLVPEAASSLLLPRLIGHQKASELLLLAAPFDAKTALALGLVNEVVETGQLEAVTLERAARIAAQPPEAVRLSKKLLKSGTTNIAGRIREEAEIFAERLTSPEVREAMEAFLEKRKPDFSKLD